MIQKIALVLIGAGVLSAFGYSLWWVITAHDISLFWRIAIGVIIVGSLLILASVGWERYRTGKGKEKEFKEVKY